MYLVEDVGIINTQLCDLGTIGCLNLLKFFKRTLTFYIKLLKKVI